MNSDALRRIHFLSIFVLDFKRLRFNTHKKELKKKNRHEQENIRTKYGRQTYLYGLIPSGKRDALWRSLNA